MYIHIYIYICICNITARTNYVVFQYLQNKMHISYLVYNIRCVAYTIAYLIHITVIIPYTELDIL